MRRIQLFAFLILVSLFVTAAVPGRASAQAENAPRPINMMILIDNSCSMFPANRILPSCDASGSDPDSLRIMGADMFIARLGFAEKNESDYELGIIGIGDKPDKIAALNSIEKVRDTLASKIANPSPQPATRIVPGLQMAYDEFKNAPASTTKAMPAIVMITDGIPWPTEGQTNDDIVSLISGHEDIPLFVMLLKNPNKISADFNNYIQFWEGLQSRFTNLSVYQISQASQIQDTYDAILGQLQNTIPEKGTDLLKNSTVNIQVSSFTQKLVITILRKPGQAQGTTTILDPDGTPVTAKDDGVTYFRGSQNPVEVYSITSPRLSDALKGRAWKVKTTGQVTVLVDRQGSYRINFIQPAVNSLDLATQFLVPGRQSPSQVFNVSLNLLDENDHPVIEKQNLQGVLIAPDRSETPLLAQSVRPDTDGTYSLHIDFSQLMPDIVNKPGRYSLVFNAGAVDETVKTSPPIASANLMVDVGNIPYIRSIAPLPVYCQRNQPATVRVSVGDVSEAIQNNLSIQVLGANQSVTLTSGGLGTYSGDIASVCQALILQQACASSQSVSITVRMEITGDTQNQLPPVQRPIDVAVSGLPCTPTPAPTGTPTLQQPTATAISIAQIAQTTKNERCTSSIGLLFLNTCLSWGWLAAIIVIVALIIFIAAFGWPWYRINKVNPPPAGFLVAYKDGVPVTDVVAVQQVAMKKRKMSLTIGGDRQNADILVDGLPRIEFSVEWNGNVMFLREVDEQEAFVYFKEIPQNILTGDPKITLKICLLEDPLKK